MNKYVIKIDRLIIPSSPRNTTTAKVILDYLPIVGNSIKWGKEYYFYTKLKIEPEKNAKNIITKGEIAYWPQGNAIAIGYGPTPISIGNEIRLANKCNIWADTNFELNKLDKIKEDILIKIYEI